MCYRFCANSLAKSVRWSNRIIISICLLPFGTYFANAKFRLDECNFFLPTKRTHSLHSFVVGTLLRSVTTGAIRFIYMCYRLCANSLAKSVRWSNGIIINICLLPFGTYFANAKFRLDWQNFFFCTKRKKHCVNRKSFSFAF